MSLRIVTHCYAGQLPQYATFLRYQLASLYHHRSAIRVVIEVCHVPDDQLTKKVLDWFICHTDLFIEPRGMPPDRLFRRSIGRNEAALSSREELVWFTDVDHVFGYKCIDRLWQQWTNQTEYSTMLFPREVQIHKSHEIGDVYANRDYCNIPFIEPRDFMPMAYNRAIGGVQIVPGSFCRLHGYLSGHRRYQMPTPIPFGSFSDDVAFRKFCLSHGPSVGVDVPNLFRLRHSKTTYQGS